MMDAPPPRRRGPRAVRSEPEATQPTQLQPASGPRFVAPTALEFPEVRQELAALKPQCSAIDFQTRDGYELGKNVIQSCTKLRSTIDAKRKELKEPALKWGREVDGKAKELVALVETLEKPLRDKKLEVDRAEEAKRRNEERAAREAEAAKLRAERIAAEDATRAALEERKRLEEERRKLEALQVQTGTAPSVAKPEPMDGPPPRRAPEAAPAPAATEPASTWPWPLNACVAAGNTISVMRVGGGIQAHISGAQRWQGSGNTAEQALNAAFQAWSRSRPGPD